jgi:hypothetical protein
MPSKWKKSDRPYDSQHLDVGHCSARVKPVPNSYSGYEWSIWVGPSGRRVLHTSGEARTITGAKRIARKKLASCPR